MPAPTRTLTAPAPSLSVMPSTTVAARRPWATPSPAATIRPATATAAGHNFAHLRVFPEGGPGFCTALENPAAAAAPLLPPLPIQRQSDGSNLSLPDAPVSYPGDVEAGQEPAIAAAVPPNINPFGPTLPAPPDPVAPTEFPELPPGGAPDPLNPQFPKPPRLPTIPEPPPGGFPKPPVSPASPAAPGGAGTGGGVLGLIESLAGFVGGGLINILPPVPLGLLRRHNTPDEA